MGDSGRQGQGTSLRGSLQGFLCDLPKGEPEFAHTVKRKSPVPSSSVDVLPGHPAGSVGRRAARRAFGGAWPRYALKCCCGGQPAGVFWAMAASRESRWHYACWLLTLSRGHRRPFPGVEKQAPCVRRGPAWAAAWGPWGPWGWRSCGHPGHGLGPRRVNASLALDTESRRVWAPRQAEEASLHVPP